MQKIARVILLIFIAVFFWGLYTNKIADTQPKPDLKSVAEKSMEGVKGRYGIYIKNLKSGEGYFSGENEIFKSGSLYKLWVMEKIFGKINSGEIKEDDVLSAKIGDLNKEFNINPEEADLPSGNITLSVRDALEQMITISHNYAALLLLKKGGNTGVPVETTASDVGKLFENLYQGEVINREYSNRMLELLSRQKIADRLPKLLPEGTKIAHKTADLELFEHDGGIVFSEPGGDYIIVVLSESEFPQAAGERIANLSLAVFNYFTQK